jgi:hypothetical protein
MTESTNKEWESKPYKGAYKEEVYSDAPDEEEESEAETNTEEATSFMKEDTSKPKHNYKKRYDDLKKHYDAKLNEFKKEKEELLAKFKENKSDVVFSDNEELSRFREDYPDVYRAMHTISQQQAEERVEFLRNEVEALKEKETRLIQEQARDSLLTAHPDFLDIKETDEFLEWLEEQPSSISDGITKNNTDAKWAIRVLDFYKTDKGLVKKQTKRSNTKAAEYIPTKDKPVASSKNERIWSLSEIGKLKAHEFEKLEAEIDAAVREGRVQP